MKLKIGEPIGERKGKHVTIICGNFLQEVTNQGRTSINKTEAAFHLNTCHNGRPLTGVRNFTDNHDSKPVIDNREKTNHTNAYRNIITNLMFVDTSDDLDGMALWMGQCPTLAKRLGERNDSVSIRNPEKCLEKDHQHY